MTKEEIRISEKIDRDNILSAKDKENFAIYCDAVKRDLEASGLNENKQREIYETLTYHEKVRFAANRIGAKMNAIADEMDEINEKYKREPNDAKAAKLAQEHAKKKAKGEQLKKIRKTFADEFHRTTKDAQRCDAELNEALKARGYKIEARGSIHKKSQVVNARQSPLVKVKTRAAK